MPHVASAALPGIESEPRRRRGWKSARSTAARCIDSHSDERRTGDRHAAAAPRPRLAGPSAQRRQGAAVGLRRFDRGSQLSPGLRRESSGGLRLALACQRLLRMESLSLGCNVATPDGQDNGVQYDHTFTIPF